MSRSHEAYWTCTSCSAVNDLSAKSCENCGTPSTRATSSSTITNTRTCSRCGEDSNGTNTFHADGHVDDRGKRLCPSCWIPALKRRAELDPPSPALVEQSLAKVRDLASRYPTTRTHAERVLEQRDVVKEHEL